ncbi:hypothetical protein NDR87_04330 [Nocardia sp. CDC159]|uniref:Uncharacterized protein n=1 Tax=Nocardia pulmonis TaxID=2951408 RepID=A0A9X2IXR3_9NOCA|nr:MULTISPECIES: hypothetical protein [Nocardia]MCM6773111.1 hypothetical protein [Nocardia pulmonis]MCM6785586.1 hypothetical protein [Nocardia sp. CDC159]
MVDHTDNRANSGEEPFGPIRPEHATDGWALAGGPAEWWLTKDFGECRARVKATTRTTCAWRIGRLDGSLVREASARSVDEAKAAAQEWIRRGSYTG